MVTAFIIDDDKPSIKILEFFLTDYSEVTVTSSFTDPVEALEAFKKASPQIVFLDINMDRMNGMEVAKQIRLTHPDTAIVFTTAYDSFAVEAFEVNAADYIVKPILKDRFDKTMDRLLSGPLLTSRDKNLQITCFGNFQIVGPDGQPIKWRTEKSKELAALLIFHNSQTVTRDEIIDLMWPETALDRAVHYLHNSIYYMRKSFENNKLDEALRIAGTYSILIDDRVDNDLKTFNTLYAKPEKDLETLEQLYALLSRDFMKGEDWGWATAQRDAFARSYTEVALKLGKGYFLNKDFSRAAEVLSGAYQKNPYDEAVTVMLIKLYIATGQKIKAVKHYSDYAALIKSELGINPGRYLREIIAAEQKPAPAKL